MIFRVSAVAASVLILAIGVLQLPPASAALSWLHIIAWGALALLAAASVLFDPVATRRTALVVGALAVSTALLVRFGRHECWTLFSTLCGDRVAPDYSRWSVVYVNVDSLTYIWPFNSTSLRPPLYHWFIRATSLFLERWDDFHREAQNLIPYQSDPAGLVAYLRDHPQPALLRVAQAQQVALWAATLAFVWCAARIVPVLGVAAMVLALWDGGVLAHGYFAHAIEAKIFYLACFFAAAAASLAVIRRPTRQNLMLAVLFCAAMPLTRPQGLVAAVLVAVVCLRCAWPPTRASAAAIGVAARAALLFALAAALPSIVTFAGTRVLQPTNIYAYARIAVALELATSDDLAFVPDGFTRKYFSALLAARDAPGRPDDLSRSLARNQGIAGQVCQEFGGVEAHKVICADAMGTISAVVLHRHYREWLGNMVLPTLLALGREHVGGSIGPIPISLLLGSALILTLAFAAPWLALWGAAILVLHLSLVALLAIFAVPFSTYLLTSEPVLLSALTVMLTYAVRLLAQRRLSGEIASAAEPSAGTASPRS